MKINYLILVLLLAILGQSIYAKVLLPSIFSDNIVLHNNQKFSSGENLTQVKKFQ